MTDGDGSGLCGSLNRFRFWESKFEIVFWDTLPAQKWLNTLLPTHHSRMVINFLGTEIVFDVPVRYCV